MNNSDGDIDNNFSNEILLEDKFFEKKSETSTTTTLTQQTSSILVDDELLNDIKNIPDRFGFKIGDVADMLGIKQYILRFWEQEFDLLKPKKASNNHRMYTRKDVENAFLIKKLLYRDKFSIEGARQVLRESKSALKKEKSFQTVIQKIEFAQTEIKDFIEEIKNTKKMFN